ncbi:MAG TPA: hypothetical protein VH138_17930 [Vicinamibacterales bacterium]|nr:hypothetical protein [Vicinamibacterales bacterium]
MYDPRDREEYDPRDGLMREVDLPRGDERELVVDRGRVYEIDGEDSRALAAVGAFRVVPERDLDLPHDTVENLHDHHAEEVGARQVRGTASNDAAARLFGDGHHVQEPRAADSVQTTIPFTSNSAHDC